MRDETYPAERASHVPFAEEPLVAKTAHGIEILAYRRSDGSLRVRSWKYKDRGLAAASIVEASPALRGCRFESVEELSEAVAREARRNDPL